MKNLFCIFIFTKVLCSGFAFGQNLNKDSLISILKKSKYVERERIGITMVKSYTYKAAAAMWDQSSVNGLIELCSHENANVRCYAFLGLLECRNERKIAEEIADKHKKDLGKVITWGGCIQFPHTVTDYMEIELRRFYSGECGYRRLK